MKILLVDDHRLVADAMAIMLQDLTDNVEVTVCHTTQRALSIIDTEEKFDLVLTDMFMPGIDGLGFLHGLKNRNVQVPIVIVSSTENTRIAQAAIDQGAAGFIQKSLPGAEMLSALKKVLHGGKYYPAGFEPTNSQKQLDDSEVEKIDLKLGPRQLEVLELMAAGNSNKQIAQLLEISEATVKYHTSQLFKVLGVHNRTSCIREGQRLNLINPATDLSE